MKTEKRIYAERFSEYPDIVDLSTLRKMLGGVGDCFARRLIHENQIKYIFVKPHYWISKESIIDYLLGGDYSSRKLRVRV